MAYKKIKKCGDKKCGKDNCKCDYEEKNKSMDRVIDKGKKILKKTVKIPKKKTMKQMFVIKKY
tara:strand:+ start:136 stop:324 length:189 start_codon:yes stop_codon:yes gene_type:complete